MFKSALYLCACSVIIILSGCGSKSPLVEEDFTDAYGGTRLPQFSKPVPPEVLGPAGIIQPALQVEVLRCCHELGGKQIGGKLIPPTGCDCSFPQPHKPPLKVKSPPQLDDDEE